MKNYVVWTNCDIENSDNPYGLEKITPEVRKNYNAMFETSLASARKHLRGDWESIVFTDTAPDRVSMFKNNWRRISDLWHSEPCNILYLDSDTIFLKPTEIFGRWPDFRLFNWTTPSRTEDFENYFNAAVRYYPSSMNLYTWALGEALAQNWNLDIWDQEQVIFNKMFWSQNIAFEDAHHPELNWQAPTGYTLPELVTHAQFNSFPIQHVRILHYHGSRNSDRAHKVAQLLSKLGGTTQ